ncbi:MAG: hypothetical protein GXY76_18010 [Chloroflexi bacterium]|nr:hypothetical protein [Chloroflexota bacterium]
MRQKLALILVGLILLGSMSGCAPAGSGALPQTTPYGPRPNPLPMGPPAPPTATAAPQELTLRILHTNDTSGETDPCG